MEDLLSDVNSKQDLENLKLAYNAHTVNGLIIARVGSEHVVLGIIKENKVFLNGKARSLLESIPKLSMPMVPVEVIHITKTEPVKAARKPRAPRAPKVEVPEESFDLSGLEDLK